MTSKSKKLLARGVLSLIAYTIIFIVVLVIAGSPQHFKASIILSTVVSGLLVLFYWLAKWSFITLGLGDDKDFPL